MAKKGTPPAGAKVKDKAVALTSERVLLKLLKDDASLKEKIDGLTGELRETIGNAVEKHHLHKKAFATVKAMHKFKSDEDLRTYVTTLLAYMDMAGINKRVEAVGELPLGQEADEDEEESEGATGRGGGQVVKFGEAAAPQKH